MHYMEKITEQPSLYRHLEKMSVEELVKNINNEDKKVALAIEKVLPDAVSYTHLVGELREPRFQGVYPDEDRWHRGSREVG